MKVISFCQSPDTSHKDLGIGKYDSGLIIYKAEL